MKMRIQFFLPLFFLCFLFNGNNTAFAEEIKVGFIYISPVGDAGYSYAHNEGRKAVEEMEGVTTSFVESVAEGPDSRRVTLNMARKGYDIIFGTSFGYMDSMLKVAKKFPKTAFLHCAGYKTAKNMGNYFGKIYQSRYLTGVVAGAMSKNGVLGYVAAMPIPEVIRGINAFTLGAQSVNPKVEVRVVWTNTWYDPATEKEAAKSLLDVGADVIAQHQDSPGPQEAAEEGGVYSVGYNTDMTRFAPKAHLTAAIWNWQPYYKEVVSAVQQGKWHAESVWLGMDRGVVDIAPFGSMVPEEVREKVEMLKANIISGKFKVFTGPIANQQGEIMIAEGKTASDKELLNMGWFVKGVIGTTK